MASIPFPSDPLVTRSDLSLQHPGQVVPRSVYGAGSQAPGRNPGYWAGRLEIAETDPSTDAQRRAMELGCAAPRTPSRFLSTVLAGAR